MGFNIGNSLEALNIRGALRKHEGALGRSIERLSSGIKINRGADDPASLTVSEKFRGQIRGLNRASGNAQDGVSLIQTAEQSLSEDHSILGRMRELSIQSQDDALTSEDRIEIQNEVDELIGELDRISSTTEFNNRRLLDGSASALVSSKGGNAKAFQTGELVKPGDYKINVLRTSVGVAEEQSSAILKDKNSGEVASQSTQLGDLESMFDSEGRSILESPQTLTLRGSGNSTEIEISSDMTLGDFAREVELAVRESAENGGLEINGSGFDYDSTRGQLLFVSGNEGQRGELSFAADQDFLDALSLSVTVEAKDSGFRVSAQEQGVINPIEISSNTTAEGASQLLGGLDLRFDVNSEARIDGTVAGTRAIQIGSTDVVFTFHDTDGQDNDQAAGSITAGVTITLTAGRAFTTISITNVINSAIAAANNPNSPLTGATSSNFLTPTISAGFNGYNLVLTSTDTGTSGEVSMAANLAAQSILGVANGLTTGGAGSIALLPGTVDISGGVTIAGTGVIRIQVGDGDFNINDGKTATDITFNRGVVLTAASIQAAFSSYFVANGVKATTSLNAAGELQIQSTESGSDSLLSITSNAGIGALGFVNGQVNAGVGGNAAILTGSTDPNAFGDPGYILTGHMQFRVADQTGFLTETISFGTSNILSAGETFAMSKIQIASILDNSGFSGTGVDYGFDANGHLDFFSRTPGTNSRITLISDETTRLIGINAFGIDFNGEAVGRFKTEFNLHIADSSLNFQVGANQSQQINFGVANTSAEALGVEGLDVTSIGTATQALEAIDKAVERVSSERSRLGSMQNRLGSTLNNLSDTSLNLQDTESRLRDTDLAVETTKYLKNLIKEGAATAQMTQVKGLSRQSLLLLLG
jgi:flagellin